MDGYPVGPRPEDGDGEIRRRLDGPNLTEPWDFALGIEVERMLRDEDCPEVSPESGMPCYLAPNHVGRAHVGPHPSGYPGWTVSWA